MNESWMKDMQDRFADFEKPAPEGLLADVQREMQRRGLVPVEEQKPLNDIPLAENHRKLIPLWLRGAAVAAMVALLIGTGVLLLTDRGDVQQPVANGQEVETQILSSNNDIAEEPNVVTEQLLADNNTQKTNESSLSLERHTVVADADMVPVIPITEAVPEIIEQEENVEKAGAAETDAPRQPSVVNGQSSTVNGQRSKVNVRRSKAKTQRWEVGANVAGLQGLSSPTYKYLAYANALSYSDQAYFDETVGVGKVSVNSNSGYGNYSSSGYSNNAQPLPENSGTVYNESNLSNSSNYAVTRSAVSSVVFVNKQLQRMYVDAHHRQPVKVGLSLRYHIDDRWSVQTGIDYSYHSSELIRQINNSQIQGEQKLHFIGVPLAVSFSVWSPGRFDFYLSGGGEVEKLVKGTQTTVSMTSNVADKTVRENVDEKPWQLSVMGSGGVQFNISDLLSVYAEPGVAYYFDNKSLLPTIYQEKPFNFNLNMGIRFNINK